MPASFPDRWPEQDVIQDYKVQYKIGKPPSPYPDEKIEYIMLKG
jgi:hypothetical protein